MDINAGVITINLKINKKSTIDLLKMAKIALAGDFGPSNGPFTAADG